MKLKRFILHLLFPSRCPVCSCFIGFEDSFCVKCSEKITPFEDSFSVDGADGFCASFEYNENISPAVILLKKGVCGNADYAFGKALADTISRNRIFADTDFIVPVPLSADKKRERGYNQAYLIAKETGRNLSLNVQNNIVTKCRTTKEQKSLSASQRKINLSDAFKVDKPQLIKGKNILIIDDVCTTGSTLSELTKLLKRYGAAKVYCAACCKTPLKRNDVIK